MMDAVREAELFNNQNYLASDLKRVDQDVDHGFMAIRKSIFWLAFSQVVLAVGFIAHLIRHGGF